MPVSTLTLEERVALYAREAADPARLRAMEVVVKTFAQPQHQDRPIFKIAHGSNSPTRSTAAKTTIVDAARTAAQAVRGNITIAAVVKKMEQSEFPFTSSDRAKSVGEALHRLRKKQELEIVRKGKGGKSNIYRFVKAGTGTTAASS